MENKKKRIIGVTGGVGAGKSCVLDILKNEFGAKVILADLVAHDLMEPGSEGLSAVTRALGGGFLTAEGAVDKKALADLIFHDPGALRTINSIIHPMVWDVIIREAGEASEDLIVVEAAVFDTAPKDFFTEIWYVYASKETRILRLQESRGYSREKCESMMAKQDSEEKYRERSSLVLNNDGTKEEARARIKEILGHEIC